MSAGDLAAVLVAGACLAVTGGLVLVVVRLVAVTAELEATLLGLRDELTPAVGELRDAATDAHDEIARIDRLLDRSELVGERVDHASRLAYSAFSRPLIRALAVREGTAEAVRRLRHRAP